MGMVSLGMWKLCRGFMRGMMNVVPLIMLILLFYANSFFVVVPDLRYAKDRVFAPRLYFSDQGQHIG